MVADILLDDKAVGSKGLQSAEVGRGSHHIDVVVQFLWKGVAEGADDGLRSLRVGVDAVCRVKHALGLGDGH